MTDELFGSLKTLKLAIVSRGNAARAVIVVRN
jgi:hypothetical protein